MYIGILQAALSSLALIYNKKIVSNKSIGDHLQVFFMKFLHLILVGILLLIGVLSFGIPEKLLTWGNVLLLIVSSFFLYITYLLRNIAYRNEKISTLQPFAMLYQVLPPIIAFLFIESQRGSLITFVASVVASLIILFSSIDLKTFKINKYSLMVLTSSLIKSVQMFAMVYFVQYVSGATFYAMETLVLLIIATFFTAKTKQFGDVKTITRKYLGTVVIGQLIILSSIILSLTMFKNFGVVMTSLLSLLYLVFTFLFSYLFLKEVPTKKDVIVTSLVSVCVILGVVFS